MKIERPKEFWIYSREADILRCHALPSPMQEIKNKYQWHGSEVREYHVIEKSAYDKAIDELKSVLNYKPSHFIEHDDAQDIIFSIEQTLKDLGEL